MQQSDVEEFLAKVQPSILEEKAWASHLFVKARKKCHLVPTHCSIREGKMGKEDWL